MTEPMGDEEFTELVDADIPRVDLVGKAANGMRFLIAKSAEPKSPAGLFEPGFVRELVGKSEPLEAVLDARQRLQLVQATGLLPSEFERAGFTPAQAMAIVHAAAVRKAEGADRAGYVRLVKAKYSAEQLRDLGAKGHAMSLGDGEYDYPIDDDEDLTRAIRAVGRGGADHDKVRRYIARRAKEMGRKVPDNWSSDGSLKEDAVAKADDVDMDPMAALAEPDPDAPGDPADPGSPAWEAVDAASARKWTALLVRAKGAIGALAEREGIEAATGDGDDFMAVLDLEDAACAIDCAIGILARFAVDEQAEADFGAEELAAVGKALAGFDTAALEVIEGLAPVVKAGHVLSAGNEAAIRGAVEALQKVLASLPAPTDESGQAVAKTTKETVMPATAIVEPPQDIPGVLLKAGKKPMYVVCDANGKPVGVCDPDDIMPIADMGGAEPDDGDGDDDGQEAATAAPAADDGTGEDAAVIPGTQTVASPAPDEDEVQKAAQAGLAPMLAEALTPIVEELRRNAGLADVVKGLQERVEHLAAMPDDRKSPLFNGSTGTAGLLSRGDQGDPLAELRKGVQDAPDEVTKMQRQTALGIAAIKERFSS